jgi:hypothetical protein
MPGKLVKTFSDATLSGDFEAGVVRPRIPKGRFAGALPAVDLLVPVAGVVGPRRG